MAPNPSSLAKVSHKFLKQRPSRARSQPCQMPLLPRDRPPGASTDPTDNYVTVLYTVCTIFPILATSFLALRLWSRRLRELDIWWDDWVASLAVVFVWIDYVFVIQSIHHGKGRHRALLSQYDQEQIRFWSYWFSIFYPATPPTIKSAALLLYWRIFRLVDDTFSRLIRFMLVLVPLWGLSSVLLSAFGCVPISAFWTGKGHCISEHAWVLGFGIPNIVLDVTVWAMPIPRVWAMQRPRAQKWALTAIFIVGLIDCALATIRLAGSAESLGDWDTSYSWAPAMWWCLIHTCVGIMVICLPTMRVLITKFRERFPLSEHVGLPSDSDYETGEPRKLKTAVVHDVGMSLSGDNENSFHNNIIALTLRSDSTSTAGAESCIHVRSEFTLKDEIKVEDSIKETNTQGLVARWNSHRTMATEATN